MINKTFLKYRQQNNLNDMNPLIKNNPMKKIFSAILLVSITQVASAQLLGGGLTGSGTRMLQVNSSGELTPLSPGTSSQVLFGNGVWGNLPSDLWTPSGSNIYFNTGKVGIGTNNPQFPLDVTGNVNINGSITTNSLTVSGTTNLSSITSSSLSISSLAGAGNRQAIINSTGQLMAGSLSSLATSCTSGAPNWSLGGDNLLGVTTGGDLTLGTCDATDLMFKANGNKVMWFNNATGNAQLGGAYTTTSSKYRLSLINDHAQNTANPNGLLVKTQNMANGDINTLLSVDNDLSAALIVSGPADPNTNLPFNNFTVYGDGATLITSSLPSHPYLFGITNDVNLGTQGIPTPAFYVTPDCATHILTDFDGSSNRGLFSIFNDASGPGTQGPGDVGLGFDEKGVLAYNTIATTGAVFAITGTIPFAGDAKLFEVTYNGQAYAREIFVQATNFPDYVFKKDYKLLSLRQVEKFIQENQHLPNIPSAEEIAKKGQNVGDIQKMQMEKIEELTLYMIEFDKKMAALEKDNIELKKRLAELEKN